MDEKPETCVDACIIIVTLGCRLVCRFHSGAGSSDNLVGGAQPPPHLYPLRKPDIELVFSYHW